MKKYTNTPHKNIMKNIIFFTATLCLLNYAQASTTVKKTPVILPTTPLHATGTIDKPTITLALSVEFPTIGSLYRDGTATTDNSFNNTKEYFGYFYTKGCYEYYNASDINVSDLTTEEQKEARRSNYRRFIYKTEVTNVQDSCGANYFKGNFLNWAASSSIDILRMALSGGDRYIDEDGLTVLQRAVVPAGNPQVACLWNHGQFFPVKQLSFTKAEGNIPSTLLDAAKTEVRTYNSISSNRTKKTEDLWLSSKHNGLYLNTTKPEVRSWNNSCNITSEVENAKTFIKNIKTGTGNNAKSIVPDGFYYVRAEVCTKNSQGTIDDFKDFDLCAEQPNGKYKPIGAIQRYANSLRVSALSYVLEHKSTRYGGVLRAPMRYIGPQHYDAFGKEKPNANPYAEWDNYTGIIFQNPYGTLDNHLILKPTSTTVFENSGVLNYLNKFGRTSNLVSTAATDTSASSGDSNQTTTHYYGEYRYKDPLSTLYQQALRYLQGLESLPNTINTQGKTTSDLSVKAFDGFPIYHNWVDEIDPFGGERTAAQNYACLKNNIVMIGDNFPGETALVDGPNDDKTIKIKYSEWRANALGKEGINSTDNKYNIVGLSYWAHTNDIRGTDWKIGTNPTNPKQRPGLRVRTYFFDVNEKGDSTEYNKRKSNQLFLAAKYGGFETFQNNPKENFFSTSTSHNQGYHPSNINTSYTTDSIWQRRPADELPKITLQGTITDSFSTKNYDPATYYLQGENGKDVIKAFDDIFKETISQAYSIAQSSSKSDSVSKGGENYIYTAAYKSDSWTGDIEARKAIIDSETKEITLQLDSNWLPAKRLDAKNPNTRNIFIGLQEINNGVATYSAQPFLWANLPNNVRTYLNRASSSKSPDNYGEARVNYLRGSRANEKNTGNDAFRIRKTLLGDIINSGVTYSGPPTNKFSTSSYQDFYKSYANRLPIVAAGANDGMLHAFAASGKNNIAAADEVFSYIPSWLAPKLSLLTNLDYVEENKHQSYVDAPSVVGDVQVNFRENDNEVCGKTFKINADRYLNCSSDWRTVLVSGTGAGGRGVFALDVSNPENFTKSNLMWEFTEDDDLDMGYLVSQPKIIKLRTGDKTYRWFAAVPSGVNNYQSDYESQGGSGNPTIFLLALDKSVDAKWKFGENYFKISLPFDSALSATLAPGIVNFSMLYGTHNEVTHIYAGDLQGNLWKLDFTSGASFKSTDKWNANGLSFHKNSQGQALPFYIAATGGNNPKRQPISAAPILLTGPVVEGVETFYIAFGTGKYLEVSDTSNTNTDRVESFYVLYDNNSPKLDSTGAASAISNRSRLQAATVNTRTKDIKFTDFKWGRATSNNDTAQKSGWYFDLPETSERIDQLAAHLGQTQISFNTKVPAHAQSTRSVCSEDTAYSNIYNINITKGGGTYRVSGIGILGPSIFLENEEKTDFSSIDNTGRAKRTLVKEQINIGTKGHQVDKSADIIETVGRLSWRQIYNYQELTKSTSNPSSGSGSGSGSANKP